MVSSASSRLIYDRDMFFIAEYDGEPAGMSLVLPDMNQALKKAGGRLFPLGLLKMLWHRRKINAWRMPLLGVRQEHRLRGIEVVFCCRTYDVAKKNRNYRKGELSWNLESNTAANAVLKKLGARRSKTYRIYEKPLVYRGSVRVLVTGGTGFIGSHLVEALLVQGHQVRCLVRDTRRLGWISGLPSVTIAPGGLDDPRSLLEAMRGVDQVYHVAGLTRARAAREFFRVNGGGTDIWSRACLEAQSGPRCLVHLSSLAAVGPMPMATACAEDVLAPSGFALRMEQVPG